MAIHGLGRGVSFLPNALTVSRTPAPDTRSYIGISLDTALLAAYNYEDGTVGALVAQKAGSWAGGGPSVLPCLISYSPLAVVFVDGTDLVVWNITTNTVFTIASPITAEHSGFSYGGDGHAYFADTDIVTGLAHLYRIGPNGTIDDLGGSPDTLSVPVDGDLVNFLQYDGSVAYLVVQDSGSVGANDGNSGIVVMAPGSQPVFLADADFLAGDPAEWGNEILEGHRFTTHAVTVRRPSGPDGDGLTWSTSGLVGPGNDINSILIDRLFDPAGNYMRSWFPDATATGICLFASVSGQRKVAFFAPGLQAPDYDDVDDMPGGVGPPSFMVAV